MKIDSFFTRPHPSSLIESHFIFDVRIAGENSPETPGSIKILILKPGEKIDFVATANVIFQQHVRDGVCLAEDTVCKEKIILDLYKYVQILETTEVGEREVSIITTGDYYVSGDLNPFAVPGVIIGRWKTNPIQLKKIIKDNIIPIESNVLGVDVSSAEARGGLDLSFGEFMLFPLAFTVFILIIFYLSEYTSLINGIKGFDPEYQKISKKNRENRENNVGEYDDLLYKMNRAPTKKVLEKHYYKLAKIYFEAGSEPNPDLAAIVNNCYTQNYKKFK